MAFKPGQNTGVFLAGLSTYPDQGNDYTAIAYGLLSTENVGARRESGND